MKFNFRSQPIRALAEKQLQLSGGAGGVPTNNLQSIACLNHPLVLSASGKYLPLESPPGQTPKTANTVARWIQTQ